MNCVVIKRHKRLWIDCLDTGEPVYTPPSFVKLPSREPMIQLARRLNERQSRDISEIVEFESRYSSRKQKG